MRFGQKGRLSGSRRNMTRASKKIPESEQHFGGFSRKTFTFLRDLGRHNDKAWFESHRAAYEEHVLQPLRNLVNDLADAMLDIDLSFEVSPAIGKTISRIYRDTRFSEDKSPFRDRMWIVFKRPAKDWARYVPGYFLEINPTWYRYGLGFYDAAPDLMAQFRRQIDEDPQSFLKAIAWFAKQDVFTLEGDQYKRPIGADKPEPIRTWYRFRSFYLSCNRKIDNSILSAGFADQLAKHFRMAAPLYHYIRRTASQVRSKHR